MEYVDVDGIRIGYQRSGEGAPVVLLHGYVGDGPTTWQPQMDSFDDDFTVVVWDAPGAGTSADPPEGFGMAGYIDCLAGFIDALGLERPHIAGLSFGGALALAFCGRYPAVPATLVLASAYAGWAGSLSADVAEQRLQQAIALADRPADELVAALLPSMFSPRVPPEVVGAFGASISAFHPIGLRAMAAACAEDLRDVLQNIGVPTLLVYGDNDLRAPLFVAEDLQDAIAGSTLVLLPDTGHVCNLEAPDQFNTAVRRFLLNTTR